jgi:hypothetical protein
MHCKAQEDNINTKLGFPEISDDDACWMYPLEQKEGNPDMTP